MSSCASNTQHQLRAARSAAAAQLNNLDDLRIRHKSHIVNKTGNVSITIITEDGEMSSYQETAWVSDLDQAKTMLEAEGATTTNMLSSAERHEASRSVV